MEQAAKGLQSHEFVHWHFVRGFVDNETRIKKVLLDNKIKTLHELKSNEQTQNKGKKMV